MENNLPNLPHQINPTKTITKTVADQPTVNTNTWGPNRYLNLKKFTK